MQFQLAFQEHLFSQLNVFVIMEKKTVQWTVNEMQLSFDKNIKIALESQLKLHLV